MGTISETEFRKHVFEKMKIPSSHSELANAIYFGNYCKNLEFETIKKSTDKLVATMLIYFGLDRNECKVAVEMEDLLPSELKKYYPNFTIEEIVIGINKALRNDFGKYSAYPYRPSLKMFRELITLYDTSDMRASIRKEFSQCRSMFQPSDFISPKEQDKIIRNGIINSFKQYLQKQDDFYLLGRTYDVLLNYCTVPDYQPFFIEASAKVKASKKEFNPKDRNGCAVELDEQLKRNFIANAEVEAKKMAVKKLYDQLIESNRSIEEYIAA